MTDQEIIEAMQSRGGSFVQALGRAAAHADSDNLKLLKAAFAHYWRHYADVAMMIERQRVEKGGGE